MYQEKQRIKEDIRQKKLELDQEKLKLRHHKVKEKYLFVSLNL